MQAAEVSDQGGATVDSAANSGADSTAPSAGGDVAIGAHALVGLRAGPRVAFGLGVEVGGRFFEPVEVGESPTVVLPGFYAVPYLQRPRFNFGQFAFVAEPGLLLQRADDVSIPTPRERFGVVGGRVMTWLSLSF